MNKILKNYWFVILVGLVFLGGIVYFISDGLSGVASAKQIDGKDIAFSINDVNFTADELYDELEPQMANNLLVMAFEQNVIGQTVELTEDQKTDARLQAEELWTSYQSQLGDLAESIMDTAMQSIGFIDHTHLSEYFEFMTARQMIIDNYFEENFDIIWPQYEETYSPRFVSHIIVNIEDFDNITKEEQDRMDEIDRQLNNNEAFTEVAKEFSQDGAASAGGSLGFVTKDSSLVEEFLEVALKLNAGEVSDWVESEFGFHRIKVDSTSYEDMKGNEEFEQSLSTAFPQVTANAIWQEAEKLDIDYHGDQELEQRIKSTLGVGSIEKSDEE